MNLKKHTRIVTTERVITSDEDRAKLEEKNRLRKEVEEAKEIRKLERKKGKKNKRETAKKRLILLTYKHGKVVGKEGRLR